MTQMNTSNGAAPTAPIIPLHPSNPWGEQSPLLTIDEVSEFLRVPVSSLYRWRSTGSDAPPAIRLGRHLRFRRSDLEAWLEGRTKASA